MTNHTIQFDYTLPDYVSFQPKTPYGPPRIRKEVQRFEKSEKLGIMYTPPYPEWAKGTVLEGEVIDLRTHEIPLTAEYTGHIEIAIEEILPGGMITVGSREDRERHILQWQFNYPEKTGTKTTWYNVWGGVPNARFNVQMDLEIPDDKYELLLNVSQSFEKLSADELTDLRVDMLAKMFELTRQKDFDALQDLIEQTPQHRQLANLSDLLPILEEHLPEPVVPQLIQQLQEKNGEAYELLRESIRKRVEQNVQREWGYSLLQLRQSLIEQQQYGKAQGDIPLGDNAEETLELIRESDEVAKDIFELFRFYMTLHLATVKYRMNQFWITPIPEWEINNFYLDNRVIIDDRVIITVPTYTVGTLVKLKENDNIRNNRWKETRDLGIPRMFGYQSGFTHEGIFVKAYEALQDEECEVCVILLKIGLAFQFKRIHKGIDSEEETKRRDEMGLPNEKGDFSDILEEWMDVFRRENDSLNLSQERIDELEQHIKYLNHLRTAVEHNKTIVHRYISNAREGNDGFEKPQAYGIDEPLESDIKPVQPYHWRVVRELYKSARKLQSICVRFKAEFFPESLPE